MLRRRTIKWTLALLALLVAFITGRQSSLTTPRDSDRPTPPPSVEAPEEFTALCTRVVDGDTIVIEGGERVRYIGMDTPELEGAEPGAEAATEANRELVEGREVRIVLDVEHRDQYGRLLAYVYADGVFVNAELLRRGLAQIVTYPPNVRHEAQLRSLQREARQAGRGLWGAQTG
jgi:micrococcal nuclease